MATAKKHALARIMDEGIKPVEKQPIVQQMAPALQAKGLALASTVLAEANGQGSAWARHYRDMLELSPEGRKAFRSGIAAATKRHPADHPDIEGQAIVNEKGVVQYDAIAETTRRSARVRLSEFVTISKALDAGAGMDSKWAFHYAVGFAREFLRSSATGGDKRGRKAKSEIEKIRAYLEREAPKVKGGLQTIGKLVDDMLSAPEPEAEAE